MVLFYTWARTQTRTDDPQQGWYFMWRDDVCLWNVTVSNRSKDSRDQAVCVCVCWQKKKNSFPYSRSGWEKDSQHFFLTWVFKGSCLQITVSGAGRKHRLISFREKNPQGVCCPSDPNVTLDGNTNKSEEVTWFIMQCGWNRQHEAGRTH